MIDFGLWLVSLHLPDHVVLELLTVDSASQRFLDSFVLLSDNKRISMLFQMHPLFVHTRALMRQSIKGSKTI